MKAADMRELSKAELLAMLDTDHRAYFRLRMRHASGQLERVSELVKLRKKIAKLNTVLRERELRG